MQNSHMSQRPHAGVLSTINRQLSRTRLLLLLLFFAFSLAPSQPGASARHADDRIEVSSESAPNDNALGFLQDCLECQEAFVICLAQGGGVLCDMQYDACIESCDDGGQMPSAIRDNDPNYRAAIAEASTERLNRPFQHR